MQSTITNTFSRRQFLPGSITRSEKYTRPPWALPENEFIQVCTRCNGCMDKCPEEIIVRDGKGFPTINFKLGGCTFCQECIVACDESALSRTNTGQKPWKLCATISADCISSQGVTCRSCADSCDEQAISFDYVSSGISRPGLDMTSCTGCGFCVATCPVEVIRISEKTKNEAYEYGNN